MSKNRLAEQELSSPSTEINEASNKSDCSSQFPEDSLYSSLSKAAQEQIGRIVQQVFVFPGLTAPRAVVFSGLEHGRGPADVCFRTAQALASQVPGSVCVLDANLHTPMLDQLAAVALCPGLRDSLHSTKPIKEFSTNIAAKNLYVVTTGSAGSHGGSLSYPELFARVLELKTAFDYVLIVAPRIDSSGESILLGKMSEGMILVLEADQTKREIALVAKRSLEQASVRVLGAVLNNRRFPVPEALYRKL